MKYSDFFNAYDTVGTQHTGFLQSMNFSTLLSDIPMLNELTMAFMDAHLYNELSDSLVMRQWAKYMEYSKVNDRLEIFAQFYTDFVSALYAKLTKSEKWFELLETDFKSISVTELETINHGKKETDTTHGQGQKTSVYGADILQKDYGQTQDTNVYGADVTQQEYGATQTATTYGATSTTRAYDKVTVDITHGQDTHQIGAAHIATSNTTTNQIYPLGASDFVNDNKSTVSGTQDNNAQTNTDTWGSKKDETAARNDTESSIQHIDQEAGLAHTDVTTKASKTDTITGSAHTDTESRASRTDTITDAQRLDNQTIKAYTDTVNRVKHIVISPEKYFEIEKELADIGVYDLMLEAVKETMLLSVWEEGEFLW